MNEFDPSEVVDRVASVRSRLDAVGGQGVRVVAVTKTFPAAAVDAAVDAGIVDIGENYAQECVAKFAEVDADPTVHFIGRLQRNKVRKLATIVDIWQTIDRAELGREVAKRAPGAMVMVQVAISGEASKGGCDSSVAGQLVADLDTMGLNVVGLMGIAPLGRPEQARPAFRLLRSMVDELELAECSMGMTADLEVAVDEGATMVRIGRDIFGERGR